ncbi:hypothetical protein N8I77_010212 [Diaporthe amygdali]|uniref:Uncharacterized protein n=1 Tax=Phomopsis amygdali TaxID=1214568 RepID=A0AAD9S7F9_PHOAM|nr:hypothetical protein N8I77_010212 [Diaporthe amygdali]
METLIFVGSAFGLLVSLSTVHIPKYPPGANDNDSIIFFILQSTLGLISTSLGFITLIWKFSADDIMATRAHKCCSMQYIPVYIDLAYGAASVGVVYHWNKNWGEAGFNCEVNMSYQGCVMMMAVAVLTILSAFAALVCLGLETRRIRQWRKVLAQCVKIPGAS